MRQSLVMAALVAVATCSFAANDKMAQSVAPVVTEQLPVATNPTSIVQKKEVPNPFYIYDDKPSLKNHYIPSGWMGDFGDIKMNDHWNIRPATGKTCIQFRYTAERKQGAGWAGVYWQHPANNWGDKKGGFDLSGFKTLKFKARGEVGGERIDKFGIGAITGQTQEGDTDNAQTDEIELTKDWKEYTINLVYNGKPLDLSHIIGGFLWAANADNNPNGITFYLDDIRLEK